MHAAARALREQLAETSWSASRPAAARSLAADYVDFLTRHDDAAVRRSGGPEHITASCFVLSPDRHQVLLCLHRKGGFWVQFGGHVETQDATVADAAFREGAEESGLTDLRPAGQEPVDLDRHALGPSFGRCTVHWDVGFVAYADPSRPPSVSDESLDVRWFPVDGVPDPVPPGFRERLAGIVARSGATT